MTTDWRSLIIVTVVTIAAAAFVSIVMSAAGRLLDRSSVHAERRYRPSDDDSEDDLPGAADRVGGYVLLGLVGALVLFALWLTVPYFH